MSRGRMVAVAVLWMAGSAAIAEPQHDLIEQQRAAVDARLAERLQDCGKRFVAASCEEAARAEHREALVDLRQRRLRLDDAERRQAAEARQREIAERLASRRREQERRVATGAAASSPDAPTPAAAADDRRPTSRAIFPSAPRSAPRANRVASERQSEARYAERQREIEAHRAVVEQRQVERAASGKTIAPLPVPSAPAASGR